MVSQKKAEKSDQRPAVKLERIFFIDDDGVDCFFNIQAFKTMGIEFDYRVFASVDLAIQYMSNPENEQPDLILLDLLFPGESGFDFIDWAKSSPAHQETPIIVLSGSDNEEDRKKTEERKVSHFLAKPLRYDLLSGLLDELNIHYELDSDDEDEADDSN